MEISIRSLNKLILETVAEEEKKLNEASKRRYQLKYRLLEQSSVAEEPKGTAFDNQLNFKEMVNPEVANEVVAQILTRDGSQPIFRAMEFTTGEGEEEKVVKPDPNAVADFLENMGVETFISRAQEVGKKIPGQGLPKADMPFLPGPADASGTVDQVVDALSPGGEYTVDLEEPYKNESRTFRKFKVILTEIESIPAKNSFVGLEDPKSIEFLKGGTEEEDGSATDDSLTIEKGGSFPASAGIPTQTNILLPKALGMAVAGVEGGDLKAYASTDNEILDGHHRWAATMLNNPGANIGTTAKIDMKKFGMTDTLKILTAIGNALGNRTKTESKNQSDDLILERWRQMAGILKS